MKSPFAKGQKEAQTPVSWGHTSASNGGTEQNLKTWTEYQETLAQIWDGLTGVSEELMVSHARAASDGESLLRQGSGQLGSHLRELADRIDELNRFTTIVRELIEKTEQSGKSDFSRGAVRHLLQTHQSEPPRGPNPDESNEQPSQSSI